MGFNRYLPQNIYDDALTTSKVYTDAYKINNGDNQTVINARIKKGTNSIVYLSIEFASSLTKKDATFSGAGGFARGEEVTNSKGATAIVYDEIGSILILENITGTFVSGDVVTGSIVGTCTLTADLIISNENFYRECKEISSNVSENIYTIAVSDPSERFRIPIPIKDNYIRVGVLGDSADPTSNISINLVLGDS